jgi:RND family efflux transporter MFP subunit
MAQTALIRGNTALQQAQADYDKAKLDLERCSIKAPIAGFFVDRSIELGQAMNRGQNMGRVIYLDTIYVEAKIADKDLRKIKIGQKCLIEDKYPGEIAFINFAADRSRAFLIKIKVENKNLFFKANMFVKGSIIIETYTDAPVFSSRAIRNNRGKQYVYVIENDKARKMPIEIIAQQNDLTYATPIKQGMEIAIIGQDNLDEGSQIVRRNGEK